MLIEQTTKGVGSILSILTKKFQLTMVMVIALWVTGMWWIVGSDFSLIHRMYAVAGISTGGFILLFLLAILSKREDVETTRNQKEYEKQLDKDLETFKASIAKDVARELSIQKASDTILEWLKAPLDSSVSKVKLSMGNGVTLEVKTLSTGRVAIVKVDNQQINRTSIP